MTELVEKEGQMCSDALLNHLSLASLYLTSERSLINDTTINENLLPVRPVNCARLSYWILAPVLDTCSRNKLVHFRDCTSCLSHQPFHYGGTQLNQRFQWHYSAPLTIFGAWKPLQIIASINLSKDVHRYWTQMWRTIVLPGNLLICLSTGQAT